MFRLNVANNCMHAYSYYPFYSKKSVPLFRLINIIKICMFYVQNACYIKRRYFNTGKKSNNKWIDWQPEAYIDVDKFIVLLNAYYRWRARVCIVLLLLLCLVFLLRFVLDWAFIVYSGELFLWLTFESVVSINSQNYVYILLYGYLY